MLWLAGLMGIIGAGAASIVTTAVDTNTDEADDDATLRFEPEEANGDLLDAMDSFTDDDTPLSPALHLDLDALGERSTAFFEMVDQDPDLPQDPFHQSDFDDDYGNTEEPIIFEDVADDITSNLEPVRLGDWVTQGHPAEVMDYDARKDCLVLVWDDLAGAPTEPSVQVESDPYDPEVMHVVMNNASVAEVYGDPELCTGDITMIPLSSALIVGLEPA